MEVVYWPVEVVFDMAHYSLVGNWAVVKERNSELQEVKALNSTKVNKMGNIF